MRIILKSSEEKLLFDFSLLKMRFHLLKIFEREEIRYH